jgi:PmbA protein
VIEQVIDLARRRAGDADALWRRVERTSVAFESGRLKACGISEEAGVNLRVLRDGRVGTAGTTADDAGDLVDRALASAELGERLDLTFPAAGPLPTVQTASSTARDASLDVLVALGRSLVERVAREGCQVNVSVERSSGETRVRNTAGADAAYDSTDVAVGVELARFSGDDVLMVSDFYVGADLPAAADLDALVRSIEDRFAPALTIVPPPEGALPVVFTPAGLSAILLPLEQALSGKSVLQGVSPLGERLGEQVFDARCTLLDDPLTSARPGSRPVDDEAVPSRMLPLIEGGVVRAFVYDLETAVRARAVSTGHGHRGTFGKPRLGYTNLRFGDGTWREARSALGGGLLASVRDGLLVEDLIGVGQGNVIGGVFSHPVALAFRIQNGTVTGRVKDAAVAGNVYELLKRVGGFGNDGRWVGSRWSPSLLLDGVSVARR